MIEYIIVLQQYGKIGIGEQVTMPVHLGDMGLMGIG